MFFFNRIDDKRKMDQLLSNVLYFLIFFCLILFFSWVVGNLYAIPSIEEILSTCGIMKNGSEDMDSCLRNARCSRFSIDSIILFYIF